MEADTLPATAEAPVMEEEVIFLGLLSRTCRNIVDPDYGNHGTNTPSSGGGGGANDGQTCTATCKMGPMGPPG